ncbi:MAG: bile acid:sodium symporter family protein [Bacteroidia bacterium]|nr:bile acid:sodium symporter family protein [Bacteroidia bacterium]
MITTLFLPLALFIIMLGMGLSLIPNDFRRILIYPKATLTGVINQMVFVPLLGFATTFIFEISPEHAVGVMLLAACPGGATSNLISNLANGDLALSITLTAISSLLTIITIPLIINFSLEYFIAEGQQISLDVPKTILQLAVVVLVPISIGMFIRYKKLAFAQRMERPVKIISAVFLTLVILAAVIRQWYELPAAIAAVGPACLVLNLSTMALGFISSLLLRLHPKQAVTISIESGIQNGTLAIAIALGILNNLEMSVAPAIYSLLMFLTGGLLATIFGRKKFPPAQEQHA